MTEPVIVALVLLVAVIGAVFVIAKKSDIRRAAGPWGFLLERETAVSPREKALSAELDAARADRDQVREALFRYSEVAQGLDALVAAGADVIDRYAQQWFDQLCTWLAASLRTTAVQRYRVAIWLEDPADRENFRGLGLGMFDPNDTRMTTLAKSGTLGALAFADGEHYCADIFAPGSKWTTRRTAKPPYRSVFAIALGDPGDRWGVMTIDCTDADGFSETDQQIARHFADLASLGAVVWSVRSVWFVRNHRWIRARLGVPWKRRV